MGFLNSIFGCGCKKAGGGAATLTPVNDNLGTPSVPPQYPQQAGICSGGVPQAPFLISPQDYASLPPIASIPIVQKLGRQHPNNKYVFTPSPAGVVQVQSPKVGRY